MEKVVEPFLNFSLRLLDESPHWETVDKPTGPCRIL